MSHAEIADSPFYLDCTFALQFMLQKCSSLSTIGKETFEYLAQLVGLGYDAAYLLQALGIGRIGQPQLDVSVGRVFLLHVLAEPLPMFFSALLWIVVQSVLYGAQEDAFGLEVAVSLSHYLAVYATWSMTGRGSMVLYCFLHYLDLFW